MEDICAGLLVVGPGLSGTSPANSNNTATSVAGLQIVERGRYGGKSVKRDEHDGRAHVSVKLVL